MLSLPSLWPLTKKVQRSHRLMVSIWSLRSLNEDRGDLGLTTYRKIPKISPGAKALFEGLIFGGTYIRRGLSTEGNLRSKIDWANPIVGRKFTVFALFFFVFEGNFQVEAPGGGGAYIWRGLYGGAYFRNFTVVRAIPQIQHSHCESSTPTWGTLNNVMISCRNLRRIPLHCNF